MFNWIKKKVISFLIAISKVDGSINIGSVNSDEAGMHQRHQEGLLAQSLVQGVMTQEVKELRWRIYKIMKHGQNVKSTITGYDEDGMPITSSKKVNKSVISKYNVDSEDIEKFPRKLLMVIDNKELDLGLVEGFEKAMGSEENISLSEYTTAFKGKKSLFVKRDFLPQFEIEKYTNKLLIHRISGGQFLLDFYVSKYPDTDDRRSRMFISEVIKVRSGKRMSGVTDFKKVGFITHNNLGVEDYLEFEFNVVKFDKVFEFNGSYVLRFIADEHIFGDNVLDKFKLEDLEEKYEKKERK
jgi:hypothetical protein